MPHVPCLSWALHFQYPAPSSDGREMGHAVPCCATLCHRDSQLAGFAGLPWGGSSCPDQPHASQMASWKSSYSSNVLIQQQWKIPGFVLRGFPFRAFLTPGEVFVTLTVAKNSTKQFLGLPGMLWDAVLQVWLIHEGWHLLIPPAVKSESARKYRPRSTEGKLSH